MITAEDLDRFLNDFLPGPSLENERTAIKKQYNCTADYDGDFHKCLADIIRDSMFTCNTRDLFEAYQDKSYMMRYEFPFAEYAFHATDLLPLYMNNEQEVADILEKLGERGKLYAQMLDDKIPNTYKKYFASFALSGDPNEGLSAPELPWPVADGSTDALSDVMNVNWGLFGLLKEFRLVEDNQNKKSACSFWTEIAENITFPQVDIDGEQRVLLTQGPEEL